MWESYFCTVVDRTLAAHPTHLEYALETASKETRLAMMRDYFDHPRERRSDEMAELVELFIKKMVTLYTPAGKFGTFIEEALHAVKDAEDSKGEMGSIFEKVKFMIDFEYRTNREFKRLDHMPNDFLYGYFLGYVSTLLPAARKWGPLDAVYPLVDRASVSRQKSEIASVDRKPDLALAWRDLVMQLNRLRMKASYSQLIDFLSELPDCRMNYPFGKYKFVEAVKIEGRGWCLFDSVDGQSRKEVPERTAGKRFTSAKKSLW